MNRSDRRRAGAPKGEAPAPKRLEVRGILLAVLDDGSEAGEALARFRVLLPSSGEESWPYMAAYTPEEIALLQEQAPNVAARSGMRVKLIEFTRARVLEEFSPVATPPRELLSPDGNRLN